MLRAWMRIAFYIPYVYFGKAVTSQMTQVLLPCITCCEGLLVFCVLSV